MTQHETPNFIVPHDGMQPEIGDIESYYVATKFRNLYNDILAQRLDEANIDSPSRRKVPFLPDLDYNVPIDDKSEWVVEHFDVDELKVVGARSASEVPQKVISLHHVVEGETQASFSYTLAADNIVRRHTELDIPAKEKLKNEMGLGRASILIDDPNNPFLVKTADEARDEFRNGIENNRFEEEMGLNDQPVGYAEMQGLANLLMDADPAFFTAQQM
jgi:hypothetical protein